MQLFKIISILVFIFILSGCETDKEKETYVNIETEFGNMKVLLYNQTPKHKENFITLTKKGFYDNLLFHRVVPEFMIQGGDPESLHGKPQQKLGNGDIGYKLEPEFNSDFFHKKGAVAAAREPDISNPLKKSSGSQFYIVQGKIWTDKELDLIEKKIRKNKRSIRIDNYIYSDMKLMKKADTLQATENFEELDKFYKEIGKIIDKEFKNEEKFIIPENHRKIYRKTGGTPFLDGEYTVFGEVTEGLEIIDSIANQKCDINDRPVKDIKMTIKTINSNK